MAGGATGHDKKNLGAIASQIAGVRLLARAQDNDIALCATVTFASRTFESGEYRVSIGLTHAILELEHPGFDRSDEFQATLDKELWSESWKTQVESSASGNISGGFKALLLGRFDLSAGGNIAKKKGKAIERNSNAPYPIVSVNPTGWQIGTRLGDPRGPSGSQAPGMDHCLSGQYFTGQHGEKATGYNYEDGKTALCRLVPKSGANDPNIKAMLKGVSGSLKASIELKEPSVAKNLKASAEAGEREKSLRQAFIDICVKRAIRAGAGELLSGEFPLKEHNIHAPKLPEKAGDAK